MKSLWKQNSMSDNQKSQHILTILNKRNVSKITTDKALQIIYDVRLCCLIMAYFQDKIPKDIEQFLPFKIEEKMNQSFPDINEEENQITEMFQGAYKGIKDKKDDDFSLFDEADKRLDKYKNKKWKSEEQDGWTYVDRKRPRRKARKVSS